MPNIPSYLISNPQKQLPTQQTHFSLSLSLSLSLSHTHTHTHTHLKLPFPLESRNELMADGSGSMKPSSGASRLFIKEMVMRNYKSYAGKCVSPFHKVCVPTSPPPPLLDANKIKNSEENFCKDSKFHYNLNFFWFCFG